MFAVLWIKVGKKHGQLTLLTTSEIEEFRRGSYVADESKPIKEASSFSSEIASYGTTATYDPVYEIKRDRLLLGKISIKIHFFLVIVFITVLLSVILCLFILKTEKLTK